MVSLSLINVFLVLISSLIITERGKSVLIPSDFKTSFAQKSSGIVIVPTDASFLHCRASEPITDTCIRIGALYTMDFYKSSVYKKII